MIAVCVELLIYDSCVCRVNLYMIAVCVELLIYDSCVCRVTYI